MHPQASVLVSGPLIILCDFGDKYYPEKSKILLQGSFNVYPQPRLNFLGKA